jgi:hypothetical protein
MKRVTVAIAGLAALLLSQALAQQSTSPVPSKASNQLPPLTLRTRIPLPGVYGRMDHYGWDSKRGFLLVAALGNNTVEIVDSWRRVHSITGLEHPQAAVYVPGLDRIVVSSQSGKLRVYEAETYALLNTLDFGPNADADNMRYDPASKRVYVAYGRGARMRRISEDGAGSACVAINVDECRSLVSSHSAGYSSLPTNP